MSRPLLLEACGGFWRHDRVLLDDIRAILTYDRTNKLNNVISHIFFVQFSDDVYVDKGIMTFTVIW